MVVNAKIMVFRCETPCNVEYA